jgi:hypothetical protein
MTTTANVDFQPSLPNAVPKHLKAARQVYSKYRLTDQQKGQATHQS